MSELAAEIALRAVRVALAALIGLAVYLVLVGPLGEPGSVPLALLSFLVGVALLQMLASNPL